MSEPVNPVNGPGERQPSAVEAALQARDRRLERMRPEEREADAAARPSAGPVPPEPVRPYRVTLDPGTRQLYTEVLDRRTGEVVLRIPPRYVDPENLVDPDPARDFEA
jgi:hypothetical protein